MFHYGKSSNFITSFRPFNIHLSNVLLVYPTLFATPYLIYLVQLLFFVSASVELSEEVIERFQSEQHKQS